MQYICADCKKVYEDYELNREEWDEPRGEFWGMPCSEHMVEVTCPNCGSDDIDEYEEDEDEEEA